MLTLPKPLRLSCLLTHHRAGDKVEDAGGQDAEPFRSHRERRDEILPGYIHLPSRLRHDPEFWTGECETAPIFFTDKEMTLRPHLFPRNRFSFFQDRKLVESPCRPDIQNAAILIMFSFWHRNQWPSHVSPTSQLMRSNGPKAGL